MTTTSLKDPFSRLLKLAVFGLGTIFFLVGVGLAIREYSFGKLAVSTTGSIVDLRISDSGDGLNHYPVVEFKTNRGETIRFEGLSTSPLPVKGAMVPVLYSPTDPRNVRINTFVDRWLFPSLFTPLGLVMLLFARYQMSRRAGGSAVLDLKEQ
ncbi:MAG: DUF3592 domain-containing protein [Schlesneria sp.]